MLLFIRRTLYSHARSLQSLGCGIVQRESHDSLRIFKYAKQNGAREGSLQKPKVYFPGEIQDQG